LKLVSAVTRAKMADTPNAQATHSPRITATAALARPPRGNHGRPGPAGRPLPGSSTGGALMRSSTRAVGGVMGPDAKASTVAKSSSPRLIYDSPSGDPAAVIPGVTARPPTG